MHGLPWPVHVLAAACEPVRAARYLLLFRGDVHRQAADVDGIHIFLEAILHRSRGSRGVSCAAKTHRVLVTEGVRHAAGVGICILCGPGQLLGSAGSVDVRLPGWHCSRNGAGWGVNMTESWACRLCWASGKQPPALARPEDRSLCWQSGAGTLAWKMRESSSQSNCQSPASLLETLRGSRLATMMHLQAQPPEVQSQPRQPSTPGTRLPLHTAHGPEKAQGRPCSELERWQARTGRVCRCYRWNGGTCWLLCRTRSEVPQMPGLPRTRRLPRLQGSGRSRAWVQPGIDHSSIETAVGHHSSCCAAGEQSG